MARNAQAALLDQLMGMDRDSIRKNELTWEDERVCKYYLAGFCPHELFVNTKLSLGQCDGIHEENLLKNYKASSSYLKVGYESKLKRKLQDFQKDVKIKIRKNEENLIINHKSNHEITIETRIKELTSEIEKLVEQMEEFGNEGKIEECQSLCLSLEAKQKDLKYDRIELERLQEDSLNNQNTVCQICGAYTNKNDLKSSVENHLGGKIHSGYVKINEVLEEIEGLFKDCRDSRERSRSPDRKKKKSSRHCDSRDSDDKNRSYRDRHESDRKKSRRHRSSNDSRESHKKSYRY